MDPDASKESTEPSLKSMLIDLPRAVSDGQAMLCQPLRKDEVCRLYLLPSRGSQEVEVCAAT